MSQYEFGQYVKAISCERLTGYQLPHDTSQAECLARYLWNITLCESLYPVLQNLEIALRNALHYEISQLAGTPDWFNHTFLRQEESNKVSEAKRRLDVERKPHEPGHMVAVLTFGFWTSLLDSRYHWPLQWDKLVTKAFPYAPRYMRTRDKIADRFNRIRRLRNRVFHHEPIWKWNNLPQLHEEICTAIRWINPGLFDLTALVDRFPEVHSQGDAHHLESVSLLLSKDTL